MSTRVSRSTIVCAGLLLAASSAIAGAGEVRLSGDGSAADNPDLLRPGYTDCSNCTVDARPRDWNEPPFDVDWSLALRGGYLTGTSGAKFTTSVVPRMTLTSLGLRSSTTFDAQATLTKTSTDPYRIANAGVTVDHAYQLDDVTVLRGTGAISFGQDAPNRPAIEAAPMVLSGNAEGSVLRSVGRFAVTLRGGLERTVYGPTTTAGGVLVDNAWQNNANLSGALRVALPVTPILGAFGEASAQYRRYDGASPYLAASLDGPTYIGRAGVTYDFKTIVSAEASAGVALRRFDSGLPDILALLYDARLTVTPNAATTASASFGTSIDSPGTSSGALARVRYVAAVNASHRVNPWLALRASAGWSLTDAVGTGIVETGYEAGAGLDYTLSERATVNLDYGFSHTEVTAGTPTDTHSFLVGLTFTR